MGKDIFRTLQNYSHGYYANASQDEIKVYDRYVKYLACGLVNVANEFRPQAIILGGGISAVGEMLTKPLQRILNKEVFGGNKRVPIKIITASLENDAGILGATRLCK